MIVDRLMGIIRQYWALIYERQWANWELLTIAVGATGLLILLVVRWRRLKETDGRIEKVRTITPLPEITDHQRIQLLQREIVKRDNTEARLEREVSELTAANKQLQRKVAELTSANEKLRHEESGDGLSSVQKMTDLIIANEQLRQEVTAGKEAHECSKREIVSLTAAGKQLQAEITELTSANEQLRREVTAGKEAYESSEQKIAALTAAGKQLQAESAELTSANEQIQRHLGQIKESSERKVAELMFVSEQLQQEVIAGKEACESSEQKIAALTAAGKQLQAEITELTSANEQLQRQIRQIRESSERQVAELTRVNKQTEDKIAELTRANEQLQREGGQVQKSDEQKAAELMVVNEQLRQELAASKETGERSGQQIAELAIAEGPLQHEVVKQRKTRGKGIDSRQKEGVSQVEKMVFMGEISLKPKSPAQQLKELAEEIIDANMRKGTSDEPDTKREAILEACDCLDANNIVVAVEALKKFINAVEAQQSDNDEIPQKEEAKDWITAARGLIHLLTAE